MQEQLTKLIESRLHNISVPETPRFAYDPIRYILKLEAKRIRPYLVLLSTGLCDGEIEDAVPAALSLELLHNFTLVHDDIMDQAQTRRGAASVHIQWDEPTAILAGDLIFSKAFQQLHYYQKNDKFSRSTANTISETFSNAVDTVCEGQALDLEFTNNQRVSLDDYLTMIEKKTAFMLGACLQMGGVISGADQKKQAELHQIGVKAGIAFQIQDDLLDVTGNPDTFGKERGGDIREGKKTYLSILASEQVSRDSQEFIFEVLEQATVDQTEINQIIELYKDFHIIDQTKEAIENYYEDTLKLLSTFPDNPYKTALYELINRLRNRER